MVSKNSNVTHSLATVANMNNGYSPFVAGEWELAYYRHPGSYDKKKQTKASVQHYEVISLVDRLSTLSYYELTWSVTSYTTMMPCAPL